MTIPASHPGRKKAFSLLELLIVVAIVAILFALLLSAFSDWRMEAERAGCRNTLRDIYVGFSTYATENDGFLPPGPPAGIVHGREPSALSIQTSSDWGGWRNHILPYIVPNIAVNASGYASNLQQFPRCTILTSGREVRGNSPGYGGNRNVLWWAKTLETAAAWAPVHRQTVLSSCNWWQSIYSRTHPNANVNRNFFHGYGKEFGGPMINILTPTGTLTTGEIGTDSMGRLEYGAAGSWRQRSPYGW